MYYDSGLKYKWDNENAMEYAVQQAVERAVQEAVTHTAVHTKEATLEETARKFKAAGVSFEIIAQSTGLNMEEIEKL